MKLSKLMIGLLVGGLFVSCSDDIVDNITGNEPLTSGFMSIAIGMPANSVTRANDSFDDGLEDEYKVNTVGLLFFTGREENAQFYKAYNLSKENFSGSTNPQISSLKTVTFPVDVTETPESLWALAVINYSPLMSINANNELTFNGTKFTGTIQDFLDLTTNADLIKNTQGANFFMINAPYSTAPGTGSVAPSGFVHLLAVVDKEKIKETETAAKAEPAAEIYVERAVAKVEVMANTDIVDPELTGFEIDKIEWVIDNTEPLTYVARRLNTTSKDATLTPDWLTYTVNGNPDNTGFRHYRFAGNTPFETGKDMYRLYYGVDPNGNGITTGNLTVLSDDNSTTAFKAVGSGKPQYCYENTFDVAHMDYLNTTRALLKVTYKGGDFYTRGIDRVTKYTYENAATTLAHFVLDNPDVIAAYTAHNTNEGTTVTITDLDCVSTETVKTAKNDWLNLTFGIEEGRLKVTGLTLFDGNGQAETNKVDFLTGVNVEDVISQINEQVTFNAYVGGVAYYAVRIKHFGDDLTPWSEPMNGNQPIATPTTTEAYGTGTNASKNYLGRYGVLRNNWYAVTITNISKIGEPTIKDLKLDKTPDDKNEPEKSIACKINILSWAKRTQNVEI